MKGMRGFGRRPEHSPLLSWPGLLLLVPAGAMLLIASQSGRSLLDRIASRPEVAAMLPGITLETAPRHARGIVITSIRSASPAAARGIAVGDRVTAIDGIPIFTLAQMQRYLQKDTADSVELRVVHGRQFRTVRLARGD
jgi:S1-C subfamily serine protease